MGRSRRPGARGLLALVPVALGLTSILAPAPAFAATASAVVGPAAPQLGGFSARALNEKGELTPKTYFEVTASPGEIYRGNLLVSNGGPTSARLRVYSVDGLTGTTTGTVYANQSDPRRGVSLWTTPAKDVLRLAPNSERTVQFTVQVPADATPGDHVGGIALERAGTPKAKGQFGVTEVIRVAVAIQIRVEGAAKAALGLAGLELDALGGTQIPSVVVRLSNTGQLLCRPMLSVALSKDGTSVGTVRRQLDTVLPGDEVPYPLPWPRPLAAGTYAATASTEGCGPPAQMEATLELKSALAGSTKAPGNDLTPRGGGGGGVPWWALLLTAVVALFGGFLLARRRPRAAPPSPGA